MEKAMPDRVGGDRFSLDCAHRTRQKIQSHVIFPSVGLSGRLPIGWTGEQGNVPTVIENPGTRI
jgi:hypothetical protein